MNGKRKKRFKNKYRIASARLQSWDYGSNAAYFVTICTKNRIHFLGQIKEGVMHLSDIGVIANKFWMAIPDHFEFVQLGEYVIMPNHVHGIVIINKSVVDTPNLGVSTTDLGVSTTIEKWKPGVLGVIINQYKRICTIYARKKIIDFGWQSRYHDHVIRNGKSFENISNYIRNNPKNW